MGLKNDGNRYCVILCSFSRVFWTKPSANKKSTVPSSSSGPESQSRDRRSGRKTRVLAVSPRPKRWATAWVPRFTRLMQEHSMRFLRKLFEPAAESLRSVCDAASQLSSRTDYTMICYAILYHTILYEAALKRSCRRSQKSFAARAALFGSSAFAGRYVHDYTYILTYIYIYIHTLCIYIYIHD